MRNKLIKLLGGYTEDEIKLAKKIIEDEKLILENKIKSVPSHIAHKYNLLTAKGFLVNDTTFFSESIHKNLQEYSALEIGSKSLIIGHTGSGKDWLISKLFTNKRISLEKMMNMKINLAIYTQ